MVHQTHALTLSNRQGPGTERPALKASRPARDRENVSRGPSELESSLSRFLMESGAVEGTDGRTDATSATATSRGAAMAKTGRHGSRGGRTSMPQGSK